MTTAAVREVLLEIVIEAPRERVWRALVDQTTDWWHKDFYTAPAEGFFLQPKLGGWMYEDWGKGNGLMWGTVTGVRAPEMLQVVGDLNADWGGPRRGIMDWTLAPVEDAPKRPRCAFATACSGTLPTRRATRSMAAGACCSRSA